MGYSDDGFPYVGPVRDKLGQYICAGFNGHGMPQIFLSAKAIAVMVLSGATIEEVDIPLPYWTSAERWSDSISRYKLGERLPKSKLPTQSCDQASAAKMAAAALICNIVVEWIHDFQNPVSLSPGFLQLAGQLFQSGVGIYKVPEARKCSHAFLSWYHKSSKLHFHFRRKRQKAGMSA
jgi:hypothetical protein